jgi:hypothetical protein
MNEYSAEVLEFSSLRRSAYQDWLKPSDGKHHLYRHFDGMGRLLYVGESLNAVVRLAAHGKSAHWFDDIRRVEIEVFPDRESARAAETKAIRDERPLHNIRGAAA